MASVELGATVERGAKANPAGNQDAAFRNDLQGRAENTFLQIYMQQVIQTFGACKIFIHIYIFFIVILFTKDTTIDR